LHQALLQVTSVVLLFFVIICFFCRFPSAIHKQLFFLLEVNVKLQKLICEPSLSANSVQIMHNDEVMNAPVATALKKDKKKKLFNATLMPHAEDVP